MASDSEPGKFVSRHPTPMWKKFTEHAENKNDIRSASLKWECAVFLLFGNMQGLGGMGSKLDPKIFLPAFPERSLVSLGEGGSTLQPSR